MIVVIPTCGESQHLLPLVEALVPVAKVYVLINNMTTRKANALNTKCSDVGGWPITFEAKETNIYAMWNHGFGLGRRDDQITAILNDDVMIDPVTVPLLEAQFQFGWSIIGWDYVHWNQTRFVRVQSVSGTYRKGGIGGFAFAVNPHKVRDIDTRFQWWGGDDDLVYRTLADGGTVGLASGLGVVHHTSTSAQARPQVLESVGRDRALLLDKWGDAW